MDNQFTFNFKTDTSKIHIPENLNNPFGLKIPEIVAIAAGEFQDFIATSAHEWKYDFQTEKGKMFGILVVQKEDNSLVYFGTISGALPRYAKCDKFIPSVLNDSEDDFFNKGMRELTTIGNRIKEANKQFEINRLIELRKLKSLEIQQRLFENTHFLNIQGKELNVLQIFERSSHGNPPAAAGECAAPKLLQYALKHKLKPIALAEFWWGNPPKNQERKHKAFYPACKNRCRPILEYMLGDTELFKEAKRSKQ